MAPTSNLCFNAIWGEISFPPSNSWKCILGWKIKVHLEGKHNRIDERCAALKTTDVLMLFNVLVH